MKRSHRYTPASKMCDLISENYSMFSLFSRFNIPLGLGDKTIKEVCDENDIDVKTFLHLVHFLLFREGASKIELDTDLSVELIIRFLEISHEYFLNYRLPTIRTHLLTAVDDASRDLAFVVRKYFDQYQDEVNTHMQYENKHVFPYVRALLRGEKDPKYNIETFRKRHDQVEFKMIELKNILIKYSPLNSTYELNNVLHDLFSCERELKDHNDVEDLIFIPKVAIMEKNL